MREIKFRAWTGLVMEYRVVVGQLGAFYVEGIDPQDSACMSSSNTKYYPETPIMQFTGLLDKSGKEIYEGDLIEWYHFNKEGELFGDNEVFFEAYYNEDEASFECNRCHYQGNRCGGCVPYFKKGFVFEVIGNIYENPDLTT